MKPTLKERQEHWKQMAQMEVAHYDQKLNDLIDRIMSENVTDQKHFRTLIDQYDKKWKETCLVIRRRSKYIKPNPSAFAIKLRAKLNQLEAAKGE